MKRSSTMFLKGVILLIGIIALASLIWFPQTEGRAANLDLIGIYTDPLIIYVYIASTPFFLGLYQAFRLLHFIDADLAFSQSAVDTLRYMKLASLSLVGCIAVAVLYIRFFAQGDDSAGPTVLGVVICFAALVIATAAAVFQRLLQNAVDIKSENDLTV